MVGDDTKAYDRLCEAFSSNKVAGHARVMMLNPVHEDIPALVVLLQATCNTFTNFDVQKQWREIRDLYHIHLQEILGPLVGHASDGDSRRRKLQLIDATSKDGERYEINHENFAYSALKGPFGTENLADQDFIHNAKKLINSLRHASRKLRIGGNLCTMNYLEMLFHRESILQPQHGLQMTDVERADGMNWESAQRVLFPRVRACLSKINDGESKPRENVSGTIAYLFVCWRYVEIFYSLEANLAQRITYASYVANFLRIWRASLMREKGKTLKDSFISREAYQDVRSPFLPPYCSLYQGVS